MTLPWVRHLWRENERRKARAELDAMNAAALGSAAKYGGDANRAFRSRANELTKIIEATE